MAEHKFLERVPEAKKRELLTWFFATFRSMQFYSFASVWEEFSVSEHRGLSDNVRMDEDEFAHTILKRMKKSVSKSLYKKQFPDHYISICKWKTMDLVSCAVVPLELRNLPGGQHPITKAGECLYNKWEFPTGVMWGPVSNFSKGEIRDSAVVPEPNDDDDFDLEVDPPALEAKTYDELYFHLEIARGSLEAQWERAKGELNAFLQQMNSLAVILEDGGDDTRSDAIEEQVTFFTSNVRSELDQLYEGSSLGERR